MNKTVSKIVVTLLLLGSVPLMGADNSVASVNGVPILKKRVDREVRALIPQSSYHATVSDEKMKELEKKAIDSLINKELLFRHAKAQGITVSPKELSDAEENIVKGFSGSKNFQKALSQAGVSLSEFRTELNAEESIRKLYESKIKMTFSDDDLKEYYEKNRYKFKEPEKIDVQMIYTRNDPEIKDGKKIAKKRADEAMEKIKKGDDFAAVAAKYSNDMTRIKGGNLGLIHKGRIENEAAEKVAFGLKKGEISSIVETDVGCFIFRLKDRKAATQLSFDRVKESLRDELKSNREKEKMDSLLESLKKQAKIKR